MARPISSDIILVNRGGVDYQTSYGEVNPVICDLPLIPGPPVVALEGAVQVAPAEIGESIAIIRDGEGPGSPTNQWQRGKNQSWTNIAGATGVDYEVTADDEGSNIRLEQTFSDESELYSNEIVVAEPDIPLPWQDWPGGIFHIKNGNDTITLMDVAYGDGPFTAWDIDGTNEREISEIAVGEELVFVTPPVVQFLFWNGNYYNDWDFGDLTDTSGVTNMKSLMTDCMAFNGLLGGNWDTSNVTDMAEMFQECYLFNQDISGFDTSKVTNMASMFWGVEVFDQDISSWDTSNVTNMSEMFKNAKVFNQDIGTKEVTVGGNTYTAWDTSNVTEMWSMFHRRLYETSAFNQDISNWNTSNVEDMEAMFTGATVFNQDISRWDTSKVVYMWAMFQDALVFNQDIGGWDTSNVTDMDNMFEGASVFNQDLSNWCVKPAPGNEDFDTGASSWTEPRPVWGTCP